MCKMAYSVRFIAKAGCRLHAEETHCKNTQTKSQDCENIVTFLLQMSSKNEKALTACCKGLQYY